MSDMLGKTKPLSPIQAFAVALGRILISLAVPAVAFTILYFGFIFMRSGNAPQIVITLVAILWGVIGIAALYFSLNWMIQRLPLGWRKRLVPYLFVGPALIILIYFLLLPTFRSFYISFFDKLSKDFVGLANYGYVFTNRSMLSAFINNLLWLVFGTGLSVVFGLTIAILTDRSKMERVAKSLIFLPLAISFVGAGVIWKFVYAYKPVLPNIQQIGLINAVVTALGGAPVDWIRNRPWNTFFLIFILVWMQTGFAMVILSAALKGVPKELLEAARIDGAGEMKIIFTVIIPFIKSTIITVSTAILLNTLKIYDIVYAMTGGLYGTEVLATQQYKFMFKFLHYGRGSAVAIIILIAVLPVMWYNLKQFGERKVF